MTFGKKKKEKESDHPKKPENDYLRRQTYILSSIGLFYLIIIGLFAVPLLAAFVVVLIKGVIDFRYFIYVGGLLAFLLLLVLLVRFLRRSWGRMRRDTFAAGQEIRGKMGAGEAVQVSVLKGLLTFTYGGRSGESHPALTGGKAPRLLPESTAPAKSPDLVTQLRELSELRNEGVISDAEFEKIKARLINSDD